MEYREKNFLTYEGLARLLDVSSPTAYHWCTGKALPALRNMKRIIKITNGEVTKEDLIAFYNSKKST